MQWVEGVPARDRMGAPDENNASAGRYNDESRPVLYLSLEYDGALQEMKRAEAPSRKTLWVQKYSLPLGQLSVLDVRASGGDDWLWKAFDYCETTERSSDLSSPYPCSRRIAGLVRQAGYDCILIPGVRGDPSFRYTNVVVFNFGLHRGCDWQVGKPEEVRR